MEASTTKKAKEEQQYDSYWKLTVEYSDINGTLFNNVLDLIVTPCLYFCFLYLSLDSYASSP